MPLTSIQNLTLAIVDTETTGTSPTYNQIIEIGIIRVEKGIVVDRYKTLIKPSRVLPDVITSITGITNEDLINAPSFDEVALTIKEKLDGAILVAHNARFDYGFIKNEFKRLGITYNAKTLCTVKLSRKLFPGEHYHNLDSIIERFNIFCLERHRAFDDALVLWEFLQIIDARVEQTVLQSALLECLGEHTLPNSLPKTIVAHLPKGPGVYIFYGPERETLYVGKSVNIKSRVMSHFSGDHQSSKELTMCEQIADIEARETTGELSALFLESKLIKELSPIYNRMLRKAKQLAVVTEKITGQGYKTVSLEYQDEIEPSEIDSVLGIFRNIKQAKEFLAEAAHEHALCPKILELEKSKNACFQYQLENCKGACLKKEDPLAYNLRFDAAFKERRLRAWPYRGAIVVKEEVEDFEGTAYVIDKWCVAKTIQYTGDYFEETESESLEFDYDSYKILARHLLKPAVRRSISMYTAGVA